MPRAGRAAPRGLPRQARVQGSRRRPASCQRSACQRALLHRCRWGLAHPARASHSSLLCSLPLNPGLQANAALEFFTDLMLEQYLDGPEVDVDIVMTGGEVVYANVVDNWPTYEPWFQVRRRGGAAAASLGVWVARDICMLDLGSASPAPRRMLCRCRCLLLPPSRACVLLRAAPCAGDGDQRAQHAVGGAAGGAD